jgi:hypothetical protein
MFQKEFEKEENIRRKKERQKKLKKNFKQDKMERLKKENYQQQILSLHKSKEIKNWYKKYKTPFNHIFQYYIKNVKVEHK